MKIARQSKIVELINEYDIETQEELAARLNAAGFKVTQAPVSRDIREMKLMKMARQDGGSKYGLVSSPNTADSEKYIRVLRDAYLSMDIAQNILVIKTTAGMANAAAAALDHISFQEIVGSLAGDDTIACFCKNEGQAMTLMNKIKKVIHVYE